LQVNNDNAVLVIGKFSGFHDLLVYDVSVIPHPWTLNSGHNKDTYKIGMPGSFP